MRSYFDSLGNPQKRIYYSGDGVVITFHYDSNQVLTEKFRQLRSPNFGVRTLMKYDSIGRLIGSYRTYSDAEADINIDTISVEQLFFYNDQDKLIRKKTNYANGVIYWRLIEYENDTLTRKIETLENDTISIRNYFYQDKKLISVSGKYKTTIFKESYFYDSLGNLIEKIIESDEKPKEKKVYSPYNQKKLYKYDHEGRLTEIKTYSVSGDSNRSTYYKYQ